MVTEEESMSSLQRIAQMVGVSALLMTATVACAAKGQFERTLPVSGPVELHVASASGDIHVRPGNDGEVQIVGHVYAGNGWGFESPEERIREVVDHPPVDQMGSVIEVGHSLHVNNVSIDYYITVPKGTEVEANSASGDIYVEGVEGPLRAESASGDLHASGVNGTTFLHDTSGDIRATIDQAPNVEAQDISGDITLRHVRGMLHASTVSGDLTVSGAPADGWRLHSVSGDVELNTSGAGPFVVHATSVSGDIHNSHGGGNGPTVRVATVSGDITVH
jgi:hypothetical protein